MEYEFWNQRWQTQDIGFHLNSPNPYLTKYFSKLELTPQSTILVPLCGKTRDIAWLLANGFHVIGIELVEVAVQQLFDELGITPTISQKSGLTLYQANDIDIFVGNIFSVSADHISNINTVSAIYDRAALVALPENLRKQYTQHIKQLSHCAPQLVICYEYSQQAMSGPPFSISDKALNQYYAEYYSLRKLSSEPVEGKLKGQVIATENSWLLTPNY